VPSGDRCHEPADNHQTYDERRTERPLASEVAVSRSLKPIYQAVRKRGLAPVAKDLGLSRLALAGALLGRARSGTLALIEQRWRALPQPEARP
jgi:hypothetical protein